MAAHKDEIIIEYIVRGDTARVTAVDPVTATEASIVGPASAGRARLEGEALRKLDYLLKRRKTSDNDHGPGIIV